MHPRGLQRPVCRRPSLPPRAVRTPRSGVAAAGGAEQGDALLSAAELIQAEHLALGEARFPEGISPVTAGNALALLVQDSILACEGSPTRREAKFRPGERWDELPQRQLRLAQALQTA